ncbi:MAG: hypothetical protein ACXVEF_43890 [Polyangiales bacterium]
MRLAAFLVLAPLVAGCARCSAEPVTNGRAGETEADRVAAKQTLERYFRAVNAKDCVEAGLALQKTLSPKDCDALKASAEHSPIVLVEILEAKPDGRENNVVLLRARIRKVNESEAIYQVERTPQGWRVRL